MNILVTGGSGFFGKSLLSWWMRNPGNIKQVSVLARRPEVLNNSFSFDSFPFKVSFISHDILEPFEIDKAFDYVIHGASPSRIQLGRENPELLRKIVIQGTRNALDVAKRAEAKKFLFISFIKFFI